MTKRIENRIARTDEIIKNLTSEGYELQECTIGALYANIMAAVVCIPFLVPLIYMFDLFNNGVYDQINPMFNFIFIPTTLALIFVHEIIHAIFMGIFSNFSWKDVELGFNVKVLTPYCTCQTPIKRRQYIITLLMPTILLGFIPGITSIVTGSLMLMLISFCMIVGGGGDLMIARRILVLKGKGKIIKIIDHPTKCGFYSLIKDKSSD